MRDEVIEDFVIPATTGHAVKIPRGHRLRISLVEGPQVGDCAFFNAADPREQFHVGQSWALNVAAGTGSAKALKHFYSRPPRENVMLTAVADPVANHWANMGGRCSARWYELRLGKPVRPNCQDNLAAALAPFGIAEDAIGDVYNLFMNVELTRDGGFKILPPTAKQGDYIELRAEMDILAAISACPGASAATNAGVAKPLGVTVLR